MLAEGDAVFVVVRRNPDLSKSERKRVICERIVGAKHHIVLGLIYTSTLPGAEAFHKNSLHVILCQ